MRISVIESDSRYAAFAARGCPKCDVLLNGEKLRDCYTADEELGEVLVARFEGAVVVVEEGEIATEWRRGTVQIVWP